MAISISDAALIFKGDQTDPAPKYKVDFSLTIPCSQ
jgi:hypothetical protein